MAYRRGRKGRAKYTWLPNWGSNYTSGEDEYVQPALQFSLDVGFAGDPIVGVLPMARDSPTELRNVPNRDEYTMADAIGSEYFLRRIVGKIHVVNMAFVRATGALTGEVGPVFVKVGCFVGAADTQTPDLPRDFTSEGQTSYNPGEQRALREPWIWQRSWMLGSSRTAFVASATPNVNINRYRAYVFPPTNVEFQGGGFLDGSHVDIKTARRIRQDERLWFVGLVQTAFPFGREFDTNSFYAQVDIQFDYRILGGLRKARQRGAF